MAGINRYDGSQAQTKRVFHARLWATTLGWPGDGTSPTQALERYTGRFDKKLDPASSLIEMGARPYDPNLGRFLAPDPVEGGSLNAYDYGNQDPLGQYDLAGTESSGCPWPSRIPFIGDAYCEGFQSMSPTWQGVAGATVEAGPYVVGPGGAARGAASSAGRAIEARVAARAAAARAAGRFLAQAATVRAVQAWNFVGARLPRLTNCVRSGWDLARTPGTPRKARVVAFLTGCVLGYRQP